MSACIAIDALEARRTTESGERPVTASLSQVTAEPEDILVRAESGR